MVFLQGVDFARFIYTVGNILNSVGDHRYTVGKWVIYTVGSIFLIYRGDIPWGTLFLIYRGDIPWGTLFLYSKIYRGEHVVLSKVYTLSPTVYR